MQLFPRQREFIEWLEERERTQTDGLVEKSRDVGMTWLCVAFLVHRWLFRAGFHGSVGSRKLDLVDRLGDPDAILEKARILLRHLPVWMLPPGFSLARDMGFCRIQNPANGSSITGEAGDQIGRGGRSSMYFLDEAAFIERPMLAEAALAANTNVRIDVSTPHGLGNPFAQKRFSGDVAVFTFDWRDDPRKGGWQIINLFSGEIIADGPGGTQPPTVPPDHKLVYPWYEDQRRRLVDPTLIAQEIDRDYTASLEDICIPARWVRAAVELSRRLELPYHGPIVAGLDVADGGGCDNVLVIRQGPTVLAVHVRSQGNTTDTANWALDLARTAGVHVLHYDRPGPGAGIAGTFASRSRTRPLGLITNGVNVGATPTNTRWPNGLTSREMFANLKSELWWTVRRRFERTYELVECGIQHPLDELISIPNDPQLVAELSNVRYCQTEAGKILMEKKTELRARGVGSPDRADALMLAFAPLPATVRAAAGGRRTALESYVPR